MKTYIQYILKTLEPIKMGAQGCQNDMEYTLSYITGSSVRGAIIGRYIQKEKIHEDIAQNSVYRKILTDEVRFLDAYIQKAGKMAIPIPLCYYGNKHELKQLEDREVLIKNAIELNQDLSEEDQQIGAEQFGLLNDYNFELINIEKTANLHITKQKKEENIFRYEAIEKGQEFCGFIYCEEEHKELIKALLKNAILFIGGSKGSGYGKCKISEVNELDEEEYYEKINIEHQVQDERLILYCLSNVIAYNEFGQVVGQISTKELEEILGIKNVKLDKAYVRTVVTSGYNHKLGCRLPQVTAIQAGSVLSYIYEGEIDEEEIRFLEERGIGLRKNEGYGRVLCNISLDQEYIQKYQEVEIIKPIDLSNPYPENKRILERIVKSIDDKRKIRSIQRAVIYTMSNSKPIWKLTKAQQGRLFSLLVKVEQENDKQAKNIIEQYCQDLKKTKQDYILTKLQGRNLYDFLLAIIDDNITYEELVRIRESYEEVDLFGLKPKEVKTEFYKKCAYLKAVLHYMMWGEEKNA